MTAPEAVIPASLRRLPQWVVYRREKNEAGKVTKRPYQPHDSSRLASSTNAATWATYEDACKAVRNFGNHLDGIGFVFTQNDPYCGIDLDHCIGADGELTPFAESIIGMLDSYAEYSPSGDGIHVIVQAEVPAGHKNEHIEIYSSGRYFTFTGRHFAESPVTVESRQDEVMEIWRNEFPERPSEDVERPVTPVSLDDRRILQAARSAKNGPLFSSLFDAGDIAAHGSNSEADLALCNLLAFWTGRDPVRIDALFRQSALYRKKWDERHFGDGRTYGQATIEKAIAGAAETFSGTGIAVSRDSIGLPGYQAGEAIGELVAEGETPAPPKLFVWAHELDALPEIEWVIEDIAPADSLCMMFGGFGSRKTFLLLDMACSIATGRPWHGHEVTQGKVVYVFGEGLRGLRRRVRAWEEMAGRTVSSLAFVPRAIRMLDRADLDLLIQHIEMEIDEAPRAIYVDTLARAMVGGDENDQKDMGLLIDASDRLRRATGASVWFAHHTNRSDEYRGSSALPGALDVMVKVESSGESTTITCEKSKDTEQFDSMNFIAKPYGQSIAMLSTSDESVVRQAIESLRDTPSMMYAIVASHGKEGVAWGDWLRETGLEKGVFSKGIATLRRFRLVTQNKDKTRWMSSVKTSL